MAFKNSVQKTTTLKNAVKMIEELEERQKISTETILHISFRLESLIKVLIDKGIFTNEELTEEVKKQIESYNKLIKDIATQNIKVNAESDTENVAETTETAEITD